MYSRKRGWNLGSIAAFLTSVVAATMLGLAGTGKAQFFPPPDQGRRIAPALVAEQTRRPGYNDFLRLIFFDLKPPPTTLGSPSAYRVFFGATAYYEPPVTIRQFANFSGIPVDSTAPLFAMRCIPPSASDADPALATWPNLIPRMLEDYEEHPPAVGSVDEEIQALAENFDDQPSTVLTEPLAYAMDFGKQFFEAAGGFTALQMQQQMSRRFGTFVSFIGLGYAAEGTASSPNWNSAQVTQSLASPDFILKNVTLANAGCRCIEVPSTVRNRDDMKLDPDYIWRAGGNGSCVQRHPPD